MMNLSVQKLFRLMLFSRGPLRTYAIYPKDSIFPIVSKAELDKKIEQNEFENYRHEYIRPARDNEHYSVFSDVVILKFTNCLMKHGKKKSARNQVERAMIRLKEQLVSKYNKETDPEIKSQMIIDPLRVFKQAIQNCRPVMRLSKIRRGGLIYQVPGPITETRSVFESMRSFVYSARERDKDNVKLYVQLSNDILDAFENKGRLVKKKIEFHKTCEANRAYAHYRFR